MPTEPEHSETMSGETTSSAVAPAQADVRSDAALILEALGRMEAAASDQRAALERLRGSLRDTAETIAKAKAVADSETAAALLDELEHRIDAMIEIAGGAPPVAAAPPPEPALEPVAAAVEVVQADAAPHAPQAAPDAEHDQVPTVSGVVSRLGPDHDAFNEAVVHALQSTGANGPQGPTVAMLKAMVEALTVVPSAATPEPEAAALEAEPAEPAMAALEAPPEIAAETIEVVTETASFEVPAPAAEVSHAPVELHDPEHAELPPAPAPAIENPQATEVVPPASSFLHEGALLASLEQMGSRPFPPPEEGTAVIFTARVPPQHEFLSAVPAPPETAAAESEPAPIASFEPAPPVEAPVETAATAFETAPLVEPVLEPEAAAPAPADAVIAADTAAATPDQATVSAATGDPDFDPTDFLFGPEPEPDPAAFLLDPPPTPPAATVLLQTGATPPAQVETTEAVPATGEKPPAPAAPAPHDPLHALKAMSPEEKIALFT